MSIPDSIADPVQIDAGVVIGDRIVSTEEVQLRALRAAAGFAALGVQAGDAVALLLRNDIPYLEASFAAGTVGAHAVPINWHCGADELAYILGHSEAKVLVAHADLLPGLEDAIPADVVVLVVETPDDIAAAYGIESAARGLDAARAEWASWRDAHQPWKAERTPTPFSVIYTSGTTGRPKGVKREPLTPEQQQAMVRLTAKTLGIAPGEKLLITAPLYHSSGNAAALFAVQMGALVVLQPRFDPAEMLALIERHRITTMMVVPTMLVRLVKLPAETRARYDLRSLKHVSHTAAPCPPDVKRRIIDWWGPVVNEFYGSTETGAVTFCTSEEWLAHPGTVGKALEHAVVRVLDDDGNEQPPGVPGEIFVRLTSFSDFTYDKEDQRRRDIEVRGLVTCGDVGYLDEDGFLYLCDRKSDMVIVGGSNVYPAEIEAVLLAMPEVQDGAVFGIPDEALGEVVAAAVQLVPGAVADADAVRSFLVRRLPSFKVPRVVEFRDELPREDTGKVFKRRLREPYWESLGRRI
jgi:long-chain acyl-CoA synthetase